MARPKKDPEEKRENRLTLYLTNREEEELNLLADSMGLNKTKIISRALQNYVKILENPPPVLRKNKVHEVMRLEEERVRGYVCANGHPVWIEWSWPSPPEYCPCCGIDKFESTWDGVVKKGLSWGS